MPKRFNPFYVLSLVVGVVFLITASAYGVMAFRGAQDALPADDEASLSSFLSKWGVTLFLIELGLLMASTVAAIATDDYWTGGADAPTPEDADDSSNDGANDESTSRELD